ncbi:Na/Pi cotransporter family protein [Mesorhizobium sp. AD1-1]|uniref:Na/Pi cotransporter family protein n=1 Tax=Mesorhizobium sp. AD1-1 TaxID=2876621 RepID=UPI001CD010D5|nr:Na/Pi cotransporter family protein [Mesorhizobium sp. AD1-1]MBZ9716213.1 Na/Pi cotransporter family protein [Mesorhizobium sp. AD1-1]
MHFSVILLHLAGATMLLLFAVHTVRTGMERAYGDTLRTLLREAKRGRIKATVGGLAMAVLLQSSTAVAMLACGFAASGVLALSTGLALLLGADLGSALVVRILSFDLSWLAPVCLFVGGVMHLKFSGQKVRETGRMVLGVGFVLLSLQLIGAATGPLRNGAMLPSLSGYLADDYLTAFLIGAVFTWLVHSSVAAILMVVAFVAQGLLPLEAGVPLILGANLGGGLIAFWLSRGMPVAAQRIPVGNLIFRATGAVVGLIAIETVGLPVSALGTNPGAALVNFHLCFNAALVVASLPFCGAMDKLIRRLLPDAPDKQTENDLLKHRSSALDKSVVDTPRLALASATRELLRMGELVEIIVRPVMDLLRTGAAAEIAQVRDVDEAVNQAHTDIKLYLAEVNRGEMTAGEARRSIELTDFAINLEHAGDIIAKNLLVLAAERAESQMRFSNEGWTELTELHGRLMENMHLALNVLVSQDLSSARQLVVEKEKMRTLERRSHDRHLKRLQSGTPESIETSGLHLEFARGLKEINSLLVTVAYPILTESGDLLQSRLAKVGQS